MTEKIIIGIGEYRAADSSFILVTLGLGSCVGVCLRDSKNLIGGLIHVMLPESGGKQVPKPGKYADTGIPILIEEMKKIGAKISGLEAKIGGGASMFKNSGSSMEVGKRNTEAVKEVLKSLGIRIISEDIFGNRARSLEFDIKTGDLNIRKVGGGEQTLLFKI